MINPRDPAHSTVQALQLSLRSVRLVTTDEVLTEVLTYFAAYGPQTRRAAAAMVEQLLARNDIDVLPQSHQSFLAGLALYQARPDKRYSLTDCISMHHMRQQGIREVLTNDHHFAQEGFVCLIAPR